MNIGILGSGHGGLAMAADLTLLGYNVKLSAVKGHDNNLKILKFNKSIYVDGVTSVGDASFDIKTDFVCENIEETIKFADIIMVMVPAFAYSSYNNLIINFGKRGQIVVFPCGGFSALNFYNELKLHHREEDFIVGETASLIYTTKITGPAKVLIKSIKNKVQFSALPENKADYALKILNEIYPQYYKAENVWQTGRTADNLGFSEVKMLEKV